MQKFSPCNYPLKYVHANAICFYYEYNYLRFCLRDGAGIVQCEKNFELLLTISIFANFAAEAVFRMARERVAEEEEKKKEKKEKKKQEEKKKKEEPPRSSRAWLRCCHCGGKAAAVDE